MGKLKTSENGNSRRNFLKNTGVISLGLAGLTAGAISCQSKSSTPELPVKRTGNLFKGKPSSLQDRIERVLVATIGMQRYNWEQVTVAQALLEMGEYDLVVSFARAAIMRQVDGRFSVIGGNMPVNDCTSIGEAVLFAGKLTGDPVFMKGVNEMLEVIKNTNHKNNEGIIYHTQEPTKFIMSDAFYMLPPFLAAGYIESTYLEKAGKMRKAANEHVDNLGYVQSVCGIPDFDRPYVAPEGQAFYLLMETAAKELTEK